MMQNTSKSGYEWFFLFPLFPFLFSSLGLQGCRHLNKWCYVLHASVSVRDVHYGGYEFQQILK